MEPPLGSQPTRTRLRPGGTDAHKRAVAVRKPATNRHAPLILNRQAEPREGDNLRATPNPTSRPTDCDHEV